VLLDGAGALHVTAWLTAPSDRRDAPQLRLESDGTAGSDPFDVARFAEAVEQWARHVRFLAVLVEGAEGAAATLLPAVLAHAEQAWWEALEAERAAWRRDASSRRATARPRRHLTASTAREGAQR
jgi:hypothetical protein